MNFYDTAQKALVPFKPLQDTVTLYTCGITPYDSAHLGHIFTFLTYDLLQRRLEDQGYTVRLVRNITDVDEPIFKRAAENHEDYRALAERETKHFQDMLQRLNFRKAFSEPLASQYIAEMATAVQQLLDTGHAYQLEHDIYFDVSTFSNFGSFSGFSEKLQTAFMADRGGDPERAGKRHPLDFLLWHGVIDSDDPVTWDTPVGHGRPGWHIECSVMSMQLLDTPIDIHGGGMDLIFPHHECEIAQSESLGHKPFARHWLHVAPLLEHGEKMSKSLGNLVFAHDILEDGPPAALRLALLRYHYRVGGQWRTIWWREAKALLEDIHRLMERGSSKQTGLLTKVRDALDDNLNTPQVYTLIHEHVGLDGSTEELEQAINLIGVTI